VYQRLTPDRGQRAILGPNWSRTRGIGPQIDYNFSAGGTTVHTKPARLLGVRFPPQAPSHSILASREHPAVGILREQIAVPLNPIAVRRIDLDAKTQAAVLAA
jgi:hypothetical protein